MPTPSDPGMRLSPEATVAEIATAFPSTVRVFQEHDIDFCCNGGRPLIQALGDRLLDVEEVVGELERAIAAPAAGSDRDWQAAPLLDLIDHILKIHHTYLKRELPLLSDTLVRVEKVHRDKAGPHLAELTRVFAGLREELAAHMMKEEQVLFPLIAELHRAQAAGEPLPPIHCGSVINPIRVMELEHDSAGEALRAMRELTTGYEPPEWACNTVRVLYAGLKELEDDLHRHIHLENNILHPRAQELERALAES